MISKGMAEVALGLREDINHEFMITIVAPLQPSYLWVVLKVRYFAILLTFGNPLETPGTRVDAILRTYPTVHGHA